jgi:hypothetical protein
MTECERQSGVLARWHNRRSLGRRAGSVALDRDALMVSSLAGDHHMAFKLTKAERTAVVATLHDLIPMPASGSLTAIDAEAVLEPGRGKTKTGRFGRYAVDDRPWTESSHPGGGLLRGPQG